MDLANIKVGDWACGIIKNNYMVNEKEIVGIVSHIISTGNPNTDFLHIKCPIYGHAFTVRLTNITRHRKSNISDD